MLKRIVLTGVMALATVGLMPTGAQAVECLPQIQDTTADDKLYGQTCWDCGWIMVRGQAHTLFYCD